MIPANKTIRPAYETALEEVAAGANFGAVPVMSEGEEAVFITGVSLPAPRDDIDVIAHAIFCCKLARQQSELLGAHPVS